MGPYGSGSVNFLGISGFDNFPVADCSSFGFAKSRVSRDARDVQAIPGRSVPSAARQTSSRISGCTRCRRSRDIPLTSPQWNRSWPLRSPVKVSTPGTPSAARLPRLKWVTFQLRRSASFFVRWGPIKAGTPENQERLRLGVRFRVGGSAIRQNGSGCGTRGDLQQVTAGRHYEALPELSAWADENAQSLTISRPHHHGQPGCDHPTVADECNFPPRYQDRARSSSPRPS